MNRIIWMEKMLFWFLVTSADITADSQIVHMVLSVVYCVWGLLPSNHLQDEEREAPVHHWTLWTLDTLSAQHSAWTQPTIKTRRRRLSRWAESLNLDTFVWRTPAILCIIKLLDTYLHKCLPAGQGWCGGWWWHQRGGREAGAGRGGGGGGGGRAPADRGPLPEDRGEAGRAQAEEGGAQEVGTVFTY